MLAANLAVFHLCSKKKYSDAMSAGALLGFTLVYITLMLSLRVPFPGSETYDGMYFMMGVPYILPLWRLYDQPLRVSVTIMGTVWTYTLRLFAIAARIGTTLPREPVALGVFLLFTVLLTFTLPIVLIGLREKYVYMISHIEPARQRELMYISLLGFSLLWLLNNRFSQGPDHNLPFTLAILLVAAMLAMVTYRLFYSLIDIRKTARRLREETRRDDLTGLKNRIALARDTGRLIRSETRFDLLFLDLDRFKEINDEFGHAAGDRYLVEFTAQVSELLGTEDEMYRLSGDEFVVLHRGGNAEGLGGRIGNMRTLTLLEGVVFLGLSVGTANYPEDGDNLSDLLSMADNRMYRVKNRKRIFGTASIGNENQE
jgi:diguanylate cyclase (GGDEF)-like protein